VEYIAHVVDTVQVVIFNNRHDAHSQDTQTHDTSLFLIAVLLRSVTAVAARMQCSIERPEYTQYSVVVKVLSSGNASARNIGILHQYICKECELKSRYTTLMSLLHNAINVNPRTSRQNDAFQASLSHLLNRLWLTVPTDKHHEHIQWYDRVQ
jgi:hypothetical protein